MRDDDRRDGAPFNGPKTGGSDVGHDHRGRFVAGNPGGRGRPSKSKEFRELARGYSETALKKLYQIALTGSGAPQVRACEIIIERAWGRVEPVKAGPSGGPVDARFHGSVRSAIEEMIARAEADKPEPDNSEN